MKKGILKLVVMVILAMTMNISIVAAESVDTQIKKVITVTYTKPVVYKGAIITDIQHDEITWAEKCEGCGYTKDGFKFSTADKSEVKGTFTCPKCGKKQDYLIKVKGFVQDLFITNEVIYEQDNQEITGEYDESNDEITNEIEPTDDEYDESQFTDEEKAKYSDENSYEEIPGWGP